MTLESLGVILVDEDLCQGHGVCESEAPQLFEVGKDRKVHVLNANPTEADMKQLQLAIKYCPTRALSLSTPEIGTTPDVQDNTAPEDTHDSNPSDSDSSDSKSPDSKSPDNAVNANDTADTERGHTNKTAAT